MATESSGKRDLEQEMVMNSDAQTYKNSWATIYA